MQLLPSALPLSVGIELAFCKIYASIDHTEDNANPSIVTRINRRIGPRSALPQYAVLSGHCLKPFTQSARIKTDREHTTHSNLTLLRPRAVSISACIPYPSSDFPLPLQVLHKTDKNSTLNLSFNSQFNDTPWLIARMKITQLPSSRSRSTTAHQTSLQFSLTSPSFTPGSPLSNSLRVWLPQQRTYIWANVCEEARMAGQLNQISTPPHSSTLYGYDETQCISLHAVRTCTLPASRPLMTPSTRI
ncbi:hypothetical protein FB451DRAFT_1291033 [Mycena latifolia]|nr:hypothetical protein FB451DRAFT_1291033 [Mycena latifolia]